MPEGQVQKGPGTPAGAPQRQLQKTRVATSVGSAQVEPVQPDHGSPYR